MLDAVQGEDVVPEQAVLKRTVREETPGFQRRNALQAVDLAREHPCAVRKSASTSRASFLIERPSAPALS
jgi:hypothetical protein